MLSKPAKEQREVFVIHLELQYRHYDGSMHVWIPNELFVRYCVMRSATVRYTISKGDKSKSINTFLMLESQSADGARRR